MPFLNTSLVPRASETTIPIGAVDYSFTTPIVVATLLSITWILVCLRAFTRGYILRSFGWDDLFMVIALVCTNLALEGMLVTIFADILFSFHGRMVKYTPHCQRSKQFNQARTKCVHECKEDITHIVSCTTS
jgi:hypothetical protein